MIDSTSLRPFPEEARKGLLGRYCDLMEPTTEAPVAYHFAVAATYLGLILGRWYVRVGPAKVYPTLYSILIGITGISHKTTAANAGERVFGEWVGFVSGAGSREGMLEALSVSRRPVLFRLPEFVGVLKKALNKATPLVELFLQLYDRPAVIHNPTRKDPIEVIEPVVAILSDSTLEPLVAIFSDENIAAGLLNRISPWPGERGDPIPAPPPPDPTEEQAIRAEVQKFAEMRPGEVQVDAAALKYYDTLYRTRIFPAQNEHPGATARLGDQVWQFAMIYALTDDRATITHQDLETGWLVADWLSHNRIALASQISATDRSTLLDRLEQIIRDNPGHTAGVIRSRLSVSQRARYDDLGGANRLLGQLISDARVYQNGPHFYAWGNP